MIKHFSPDFGQTARLHPDRYLIKHASFMPTCTQQHDVREFKNSEADISLLPEDMQVFIRKEFRPDPENFCYLVINALSDEETFGMNVNGDAMPKETQFGDPLLKNETEMHGYKTYELFGHFYQYHQNKDPKNAKGFVLFSSYPQERGIVCILVGIDRRKAPETCARIDNNIMPKTSMGIRVPFDLCSITSARHNTRAMIEEWIHHWFTEKDVQEKFSDPGKYILYHNQAHIDRTGENIPGLSRTTDEYSDYLKNHMGEVLPNGEAVCAINFFPKCFDISEVFVNADKVSEGVMKIAMPQKTYSFARQENGLYLSSADVMADFMLGGIVKQAFEEEEKATSSTTDEDKEEGSANGLEKHAPTSRPRVLDEIDLQQISKHFIQKAKEDLGDILRGADRLSVEKPMGSEIIQAVRGKPLRMMIRVMRGMRIMPSPEDFHRLFFSAMGAPTMGEGLLSRGVCAPMMKVDKEHVDLLQEPMAIALRDMFDNGKQVDESDQTKLASLLVPYMDAKSLFPQHFFPRLERSDLLLKTGGFQPFAEEERGKPPPSFSSFPDISMMEAQERTKDIEGAWGSRKRLGLLETLAIGALLYPILRNSVGASMGMEKLPQLSSSVLAGLIGTGLVGDKLIDRLNIGKASGIVPMEEKRPEEDTFAQLDRILRDSKQLQKEGALAEFLPWSNNVFKAHVGALATMPMIHAYSLHQRNKAMRGEELNGLERWVALNPDVASLGYLAAGPTAFQFLKNKIPAIIKGAMLRVDMEKKAGLEGVEAQLPIVRVAREQLEQFVPDEGRAFVPRKHAAHALADGLRLPLDPETPAILSKAPAKSYDWNDRLVNALGWGLMSPGRALPAALLGGADSEVFARLLG